MPRLFEHVTNYDAIHALFCFVFHDSVRKETIRIDWGAYPHYHAPERYAPIVLDGHHLYYLNAFENAASTMETSAVAAENIARLILSRLSRQRFLSASILNSAVDLQDSHLDL